MCFMFINTNMHYHFNYFVFCRFVLFWFIFIIKMWNLIIFSSIFLVVSAGVDQKFVNFGGFICAREEKALGRCLKDALNAYIPQLANGLPEYDIPPCEPLVVPSLTIEQSSGPIKVTSTYTDVTVKGPSTMRIKDIHINLKKHKMMARVHIPKLETRGKYKLQGMLLMLPIEGEGNFSGTYGDIDASILLKLGRQHRPSGVDALTCEDMAVKFNVNEAKIQLDNLFGGHNELGTAMNTFLNQNWRELASELQEPLEVALKDFLKPLADHSFSNINADDILWT